MVEAGAKASWDSKSPANTVGLEVATKYRIDPLSFAKVRRNPEESLWPRQVLTSSTGQDQ